MINTCLAQAINDINLGLTFEHSEHSHTLSKIPTPYSTSQYYSKNTANTISSCKSAI